MSESPYDPGQQPETPVDQGFTAPQIVTGGQAEKHRKLQELPLLGNLGQSVRMKQLKSARVILIFVGVMMVALSGFYYSRAEEIVNGNLQKRGLVIEGDVNQVRDQAVKMIRLINGGTVGLGVVFILLGVAVRSFPVPATVLGLVLYLGSIAVFAAINPASLLQGIIVKILFIVCLFKAVQAAIIYQRYEQEQLRTGNLEVPIDEV